MNYVFGVTPIFNYVQNCVTEAGGYLHHNNAKETIQIYLNEESYRSKKLYIGAIQYEGSNDYEKREPHLVSWRFKRSNLSPELKQELESITAFRRDKNSGPAVNLEAESIAFKFEQLTESAKATMIEIARVLRKYT